jgi:NADH-quinone oxidoreductase subunit H
MLLLTAPSFIENLLLKLFSAETVNYVVWPLIQVMIVVTAVAVWALYATYAERKVSAFMQARLGPMRVGPYGLLQPIADAIKLLTKEDLAPMAADYWIFRWAPYLAVIAAFIVLAVIPFAPDWGVITDVNIGLLFILGVSSLSVLALILAGWSSNSKYSLMGGLRSSAQMVSYEVAMGLSLIGPLLLVRTLSLAGIITVQDDNNIWLVFWQPLAFVSFLISGIAENNRAPFDMPEAESELVAGFHTEYSGMRWSLFFMAEYAGMVVVAAVATAVFLGGWYLPGMFWLFKIKLGSQALYGIASLSIFCAKMAVILYVYFWLRWTLPRYRYDQLMDLGWRWLIPATLANIVWTATSVTIVQGLNGWRGWQTLAINGDQVLFTRTGSGLMVFSGILGLTLIGGMLSIINWRSRDFNLKSQRRGIRLIHLPPPVAETPGGSMPQGEAGPQGAAT